MKYKLIIEVITDKPASKVRVIGNAIVDAVEKEIGGGYLIRREKVAMEDINCVGFIVDDVELF